MASVLSPHTDSPIIKWHVSDVTESSASMKTAELKFKGFGTFKKTYRVSCSPSSGELFVQTKRWFSSRWSKREKIDFLDSKQHKTKDFMVKQALSSEVFSKEARFHGLKGATRTVTSELLSQKDTGSKWVTEQLDLYDSLKAGRKLTSSDINNLNTEYSELGERLAHLYSSCDDVRSQINELLNTSQNLDLKNEFWNELDVNSKEFMAKQALSSEVFSKEVRFHSLKGATQTDTSELLSQKDTGSKWVAEQLDLYDSLKAGRKLTPSDINNLNTGYSELGERLAHLYSSCDDVRSQINELLNTSQNLELNKEFWNELDVNSFKLCSQQVTINKGELDKLSLDKVITLFETSFSEAPKKLIDHLSEGHFTELSRGNLTSDLQWRFLNALSRSEDGVALLSCIDELPEDLMSYLSRKVEAGMPVNVVLDVLEKIGHSFLVEFVVKQSSEVQSMCIELLNEKTALEILSMHENLSDGSTEHDVHSANSAINPQQTAPITETETLPKANPIEGRSIAKKSGRRADKVKVKLQYIAPKRSITRLAGKLAGVKGKLFKTAFINWFIKKYKINMDEALNSDPSSYATFNDFFSRKLKDGARNICDKPNTMVHPVDGQVSQLGAIQDGEIIQAKGHKFTTTALLGGNEDDAVHFENGSFATVYLSPSDYHRVHMPIAGRLTKMIHVPGDLFSVSPATAENVPGLFARNERVVAIFDTEIGKMAMVLVGATIVSSVQPAWCDKPVKAKKGESKQVQTWEYPDDGEKSVFIEKGADMGHFKLGSTVVMCFEKDKILAFEEGLEAGSKTRMGTAFSTLVPKPSPEEVHLEAG